MNHITPIRSISENYWRTGHWLNGRLGSATLADTIAAVLSDHGFEDFDLSEVAGDMTGYVQGEVTSARALLEPLLEAFQVDVTEDAGRLRFRSRLKASLPPREIGVIADIDGEPLWAETRGHDSDFAAEAVITSYNPNLNYEQASIRSRRIQETGQRTIVHDLPAVMAEETALQAAETLLRSNRIARRSISFALPPNELAPEPGDAVRLDLEGAPEGTFLIERIEEGEVRRIQARFHSPLVPVGAEAAANGRARGRAASDAFAPVLHFLDLPRYTGGEATGFARVAAFCRPWRRMAISSSSGGEGYRLRTVLERPAQVGTLTAALPPGVSGRFDHGWAMELHLPFGELSSAAELAVLNGENRIAALAANGVWEVIGFAQAEETGPQRWRLTGLLRGLAGTEDATAAGAASGSPVVVLDDSVVPLGLTAEERGLTINWLAESLGQSGGRSGPYPFAAGVRAQTPLSPVHIRGERQPSGDAEFSWIRRGRVESDDWESTDIPLDEAEERYLVEVIEDGVVKRAAEVSEPRFVYPASQQLADFEALPPDLSLAVRQMGRAVPLGIPATASIAL